MAEDSDTNSEGNGSASAADDLPINLGSTYRLGGVIAICIALQLLMALFLGPWVALGIAVFAMAVIGVVAMVRPQQPDLGVQQGASQIDVVDSQIERAK